MNHLKPLLAICLLAAAGAAPCQQAATITTSQLNVGGTDREKALLAVQQQRFTLLDAQVKAQVQAVQTRNDQIAKLNAALSAANTLRAKMPAAAKGDASTPDGTEKTALDLACKNAGVTINYTYNKQGKPDDLKLGILDDLIRRLPGIIESMNNSLQMDMLRLQSMSARRNESFDSVNDIIKKMQESRAAIIGNIR